MRIRERWLLCSAIVGGLVSVAGCVPAGSSGVPTGANGDAGGSQDTDGTGSGDADGGDVPSGDGSGVDGSDGAAGDSGAPPEMEEGTVSGVFDPAVGLVLSLGGFTASFAPSSIVAETMIVATVSPPAQLPGALPGGATVSGASFEPSGLQLAESASLTLPLEVPTIATVLPVLTFDSAQKMWVSAGGVAGVAPGGTVATVEIDLLGVVGVPDGVPAPPAGETIGSLLTIANQGTFTSNVLSVQDASLFYSSAAGGSLSVNVMSSTSDAQGQISVQTLSLSAIAISESGHTLVAEVGGSDSFYNTGDFRSPDEPAVGVMMLSFDGSTATLTVYVATPQRVISGTLSGPAS